MSDNVGGSAASDEQEFNNIPRESSKELLDKAQQISKSTNAMLSWGSAPSSGEKKDDPRPGDYVQYHRNGNGYRPTTSTVPELPAGTYTIAPVNELLTFVPHRVVTDSLLRLPDSKSDEVITEIEKFWMMREEFHKYGYNHKRGFLLYGPQGSGKTSTVAVVMQQMVRRNGLVFLVGMTHPVHIILMLKQMREVEPERQAVVVIEDIDAYIDVYGQQNVLSLLDGEDSIANVVYIATTNYPAKLEPRVVNRPSRFDRVVKIGMPNSAARRMYLESRGLGLSDAEMDVWVRETEHFSIAHMKELIIGTKCYGNKFEEEIKRLKDMAKPPKDEEPFQKVGFGAAAR